MKQELKIFQRIFTKQSGNEKTDFVKGVLGKEVFKKYIKAKEEEWMEYTSQVTDWEIDRYLGRI